jgi:hypothetical protein
MIHFKSGDRKLFRVARHLRYNGAVLDFIGQDADSWFVAHYGYAFAPQLPHVLEQLGVQLPNRRNVN